MDLVVKHGLSKLLVKGEDAHVVELQGRVSCGKGDQQLPYSCFGIFDGHGGKQASRFCAKHAVETLREELEERLRRQGEGMESVLPDALEREGWCEREMWTEVASRVAAGALKGCFERLNDTFNLKQQPSGCTGTLALQVGWSLAVASVGDSLALVDVAHEVLQISGDHRLDRSTTERERVLATGDVIARSALPTDEDDVSAGSSDAAKGGKGVGPLRVWPGGLAMSRTIGDAAAGGSVIPTPEVRQITIPRTGCRMIVASDGLWDAMSLKAAAHAARGSVPTTAAGLLVKGACKARGQRDDVTVIVVDYIPPGEKKLATIVSYTKEQQRILHHTESNVHILRPLEEPLPDTMPMGVHFAGQAPESRVHMDDLHLESASVQEAGKVVSDFYRSAVEACCTEEEGTCVDEDGDGGWIPAVQKHSSKTSNTSAVSETIAVGKAVSDQESQPSNHVESSSASADTVRRQQGIRRRKHIPAKAASQPQMQADERAEKSQKRHDVRKKRQNYVDGKSKSQGSGGGEDLRTDAKAQVEEKLQELSVSPRATRAKPQRSTSKPKPMHEEKDESALSENKGAAQVNGGQRKASGTGQKRFRRRQRQHPEASGHDADRGA